MPLISIYILNYNYGNFIEHAIQSALNQTYSNMEILIVDDGSTDHSREIIAPYFQHPKCRCFLLKNKGLIKSSNYAIRAARGQFVLRLDADDLLQRDAIAHLVHSIRLKPNLFCAFGCYIEFTPQTEKRVCRSNRLQILKPTQSISPPHGACTLINKQLFKLEGGYNETIDCRDGHYLWKVLARNYESVYCPKIIFKYRKHNNNSTRNIKRMRLAEEKIEQMTKQFDRTSKR